jgi:hypothetical protein
MIEQPAKPDVPSVPDVINKPGDGNGPLPDGESEWPDEPRSPDVHPAPPPTDPASGII